MSLFTQWVPADWSEQPHTEELQAYADRMIDCYNEVAPNFKSSIMHADIVGPYEMEHDYGLVGGNIFHGELSLEQLFHMRPAPGFADYRTPVPGLYYASSATHAGGGVCGIPGMQAARAAMADRRAAVRGPRRRPSAAALATGDRTPPRNGRHRDARGPQRGAGRGQRPPGQPRRAHDRGGGQEPVPAAHLPGEPAVRGHRRRCPACPASPRCPNRWTWCCSPSPTPPWRRSWRPRRRTQARSAVIFGVPSTLRAPPGCGTGWPRWPATRAWRCAARGAWGS